ncbi:glutathione S-transferase [Sphingopyxis sp. Root1497]|uniref:glutathione S-transferase family protein n=1 Tax=Sphingopyxis sp. Root1497 TaxID=1736474 RepID=UPI0006FE7BC7|nr:glutathione S-transferase family protein [Sphingopyxis sp. Root1497]KQZ65028.1 glutathione S-transferase [Sphingopyxis sp. Root1497]
MKLYDSIGPNPHVVRMFLAEKGLEIPTVEIDLLAGENREAPHLARNPGGQTPVLELDEGSFLSEITAICEYIEERHPTPALIGETPEARAQTRMWTRRIDNRVAEHLANGFRFAEGFDLFKDRVTCRPEAAPGLKQLAQDGTRWFEANFVGPWICGDRFTLADILLFAILDFGASVGQPLDPSLTRLGEWMERMKARPSHAS